MNHPKLRKSVNQFSLRPQKLYYFRPLLLSIKVISIQNIQNRFTIQFCGHQNFVVIVWDRVCAVENPGCSRDIFHQTN